MWFLFAKSWPCPKVIRSQIDVAFVVDFLQVTDLLSTIHRCHQDPRIARAAIPATHLTLVSRHQGSDDSDEWTRDVLTDGVAEDLWKWYLAPRDGNGYDFKHLVRVQKVARLCSQFLRLTNHLLYRDSCGSHQLHPKHVGCGASVDLVVMDAILRLRNDQWGDRTVFRLVVSSESSRVSQSVRPWNIWGEWIVVATNAINF